THEVGSLDKHSWRVKGFAGKPLNEADLEQAREWGQRLGVDGHEELLEVLRRAPLESKEDREAIRTWSSRYGLRLQESAGLDVVYDGEQQRSEMYAWAVAHANGFEWRGSVRAFDNKYYSKAAAVAPVSLAEPYHNDEFAFLKDHAGAELKDPVTGAYTIADWSFDEQYVQGGDGMTDHGAWRARRRDGRRRFVLDVARNL